MNKRIDYSKLVEEIIRQGDLTIDQKLAKKIVKDELPKSCFNYSYLKKGSNVLGRFLMEHSSEYEFEIIPAQIIVHKKKK